MQYRSKGLSLILISLLCFNYTGAVFAKEKVTKDREIIRRLQRSLVQEQAQRQQVEQEKNGLLEKNNQLESDLKNAFEEQKKLNGQIRVYQKQKQDLQLQLKTVKADLDVSRQKEARLEQERNKLSLQAQQLGENLVVANKDNSELKAQNVALRTNFDAEWTAEQGAKKAQNICEGKNKQLYQYSKTLVNHYQNPSFWKSMKEGEPILGFGNVELQNLLQEYKDKIDQEKISNAK